MPRGLVDDKLNRVRYLLSTVRQQAITGANFNTNLYCDIASLGYDGYDDQLYEFPYIHLVGECKQL